MIYLHIFLYYTFICSSVLFFGIGLNRNIQISLDDTNLNFIFYLKIFISVFISSVLSYLITKFLLCPIHLEELAPVVSLFIFLCFNTFVEALVRITAKISSAEFSISWLIVLLTVVESSTLVEAMVICSSAMISFLVMIPLMTAFQKRLFVSGYDRREKIQIYMLLSLTVIILLISVCDISWLNIR